MDRNIKLLLTAILTPLVIGCQKSPFSLGELSQQANEHFTDPNMAILASAIEDESPLLMESALSKGADINGAGKDGITPLVYAMNNDKMKSFLFLLEKGANPNLETIEGQSALAIAAGQKDYIYLSELMQHKGSANVVNPITERTPLFDAIESKDRSKITLLLNSGADVNHTDASGLSPLLLAAKASQYELAYALIERGADTYATDGEGKDILWILTHSKEPRDSETQRWAAQVLDVLNQR